MLFAGIRSVLLCRCLKIWLPVKQGYKCRKELHLFQKAPLRKSFLPPRLMPSGLLSVSCSSGKPDHDLHSQQWQIISCHQLPHDNVDLKAQRRPPSPQHLFSRPTQGHLHNTKPGSQYIKPLYAKHSLLGLSKKGFAELGWLCVFTADVEKLETTFPNKRSPHYKVCTVS